VDQCIVYEEAAYFLSIRASPLVAAKLMSLVSNLIS